MKDLHYSTSYEWKEKYSFKSIRNKLDLIFRLLEISKFVISRSVAKDENEIAIIVSKNSRVYVFEKPDYYYSFCFPFSVQVTDDNENPNRLSYVDGEISSAMIHCVEFLLTKYQESPMLLFPEFDDISSFEVDFEKTKRFLTYLLLFEPGYVRYERDPQHEKSNHPLYHLDWNYDNRCEVKTGLNCRLGQKDFIEVLSIDMPCWFLQGPKKGCRK